MAHTKKNKQAKPRNWHALNAILNRPAGRHIDRKKRDNKNACRGKNAIEKI